MTTKTDGLRQQALRQLEQFEVLMRQAQELAAIAQTMTIAKDS